MSNRRKRKQEEQTVTTEVTKTKKKKKRGCLGCFLTFVIVNLVLVIAIVGVGYGLGNKYSKQYLGVSLPQAFKVVRGITKGGDRDKIVTNAPTEADKNSFYGVLDDTLMLSDGTVNEDTLSLITDTLMGKDEGETESEEVLSARLSAENGDIADSLFSIISRENADYDKLAKFDATYDYSASYEADFVATITDRQLMAVLKSIVEDKLLSSEKVSEFKDYFAFDQLVLSRSEGDKPSIALTASVKAKQFATDKTKSITQIPNFAKKLILKLVPKEIFVEVKIVMGETNQVFVNINGMSESNLANAMKIADGVLKLTGSSKTAQATLDGFVNDYAGEYITLVDDLMDFDANLSADGKIKFDVYGALADALFKESDLTGADLALAYSSVLKADANKMIEDNEKSLFENKYLVIENGEKKEIYSLAPVEGGTPISYRDEFMKEFSAKYLMRTNFYRENATATKAYLEPAYKGSEEGDAVYATPDIKKLTADGELPLDSEGKPYETLYIDGSGNITPIEAVGYKPIYLFDYIELEFEDIAALMGMGNSEKTGNIELKSLFDASGMRKALYDLDGKVAENEADWFVNQARTVEENPTKNLTFMLNEKMLGALVDAKMKDIVTGENELLSSLKLRFTGLYASPDAETVALTQTVDGEEVPTGDSVTVKRSYMTVGFTADAKAVFGDNELFPALVGETIAIAVRVEITPELEDKYLSEAKIYYADLGESRTKELLDTMGKADFAQFDISMINEQIGKPIRDMITTIKETLGGVTISTEVMQVPDAFQLINTQLFTVDETKVYKGSPIEFTADELHAVMGALYDLPPVEYLFVEEMGKSYHFLTNGIDKTLYDGEAEFVDVYDAIEYFPHDSTTHDWEKHHNNYYKRAIHLNHLYEVQSNPAVSALINLPALTSDLGEVVGYYDSDVEEEDYEFFTFEYHLSGYLEGADSNASLLDIDTIFATFRVDKEQKLDALGRRESEVTGEPFVPVSYMTTLVINTMNAEERETLLKMIVYFSDDPENAVNKFLDVERQIGELAYTLDHNTYAHEFIKYGKITNPISGTTIYEMPI